MMLFENIALALSGLWANKMRALLTMLGIIIGISSVIAIMTVGTAIENSVTSSMQSLGANNITVYVNTREAEEETGSYGMRYEAVNVSREMTEEDMIREDMIEQLKIEFADTVDGVAVYQFVGSGNFTQGKNYANISIYGTNTDYFLATELKILAGRHLTNEDQESARRVALVTDKFVNNMYGGDVQKALGQEIELKVGRDYYRYTIAGVYEYEQNPMDFSMTSDQDINTLVYVPLKTAQSQTHSNPVYADCQVVAAKGLDGSTMVNDIKRFFETYYRNNRYFDVTVFSVGTMIDSFMTMLNTVSLAIAVIAGISLLVGGIGVMNIMLVSITERTREIGTRKALGAPNSSIRLQFIVESMVICLIGGAIGVALGMFLGSFAASLMDFPAEASLSSIIISLVFSMSIGVFFGYYPANKAAKMDPIEALRYE